MKKRTELTAYACLYHDVGKILYRAGEPGTHSESGYQFVKKAFPDLGENVCNAVRYHHGRALQSADLPEQSLAYLTYIADNISAGFDRRENGDDKTVFDKYVSLSPVFIHMQGEHPGYVIRPDLSGKGACVLPDKGNMKLDVTDYQYLENRLSENIRKMQTGEQWLNSHLALLETLTGQIPSSTNVSESVDISLFDHLKTTAAVGVCLSEYAEAKEITDFKKAFLTDEQKAKDWPAFLLYSADLSGIQNFIYTVQTTKALKTLRSRSFFLELLMEHYVDELLSEAGLARMNLLYSGGGHCYLLLPNTKETIRQAERVHQRFNEWMFDQFGILLYIAHGYAPCSANDLMNQPSEKNPYRRIFRYVSGQIAYQKLHRYDADTLIRMNQQAAHSGSRECKVCGRTDHLTKDGICRWCAAFERMSEKIRTQLVYYISRQPSDEADFPLPGMDGDVFVTITDEARARKRLQDDQDVVRVYTKNQMFTGLMYATRLHIGDYAAEKWLEKLADSSTGIGRLGVCRMDVDNLGDAFIRGFEQPAGNGRQKYVTISRTSAFSRNMSLFFKNYINTIFKGRGGEERPLNVLIVYSGGDDVFFAGAWNDVIEGAERIRKAFRQFTCESLTISAGIGIFDATYPVRLSAEKTGELEDSAKNHEGKDAVTLFEANRQTYSWEDYRNKVIDQKLQVIRAFFDLEKDERNDRGMAFLYRIVELLRRSESEPLNLARLAYVLSRLEPGKEEKQREAYRNLSRWVYQWALSEEDRRQLITAIYIYVYLRRER